MNNHDSSSLNWMEKTCNKACRYPEAYMLWQTALKTRPPCILWKKSADRAPMLEEVKPVIIPLELLSRKKTAELIERPAKFTPNWKIGDYPIK